VIPITNWRNFRDFLGFLLMSWTTGNATSAISNWQLATSRELRATSIEQPEELTVLVAPARGSKLVASPLSVALVRWELLAARREVLLIIVEPAGLLATEAAALRSERALLVLLI
jgi:hypothetical protein